MILSNDKANPAIRLDEKSNVETPLLDQLEGLGWTAIRLADNWDLIYQELEKLRQKMAAKEREQTYGLDRKRQMPIFRIMRADLWDNRHLVTRRRLGSTDQASLLLRRASTPQTPPPTAADRSAPGSG